MIDKSLADSKIAKAFFIDYRTISEISKELYKKKRIGFVSSHFKKWNDLGYIDKKHITIDKKSNKGKQFTQAFTGYRLNLEPYFDYIKPKLKIHKKQKLKRVGWLEERTDAESKKHPNYKNEMEKLIKELEDKEFNKIEKEIINYIFSFKEVREIICKNDKLIEGITAFLERIFFYKTDLDWPHSLSHFFRQGFFIKNKKYVGVTEEAYIDRLKEIAEFERVSLEHYRKLRNKIRIISNFSDEEFFDLTVKTPLRKYQYMPNLMDIKKAKNNEEKIKMVNLWSKIYFQDEIPEGW